MKRVELIKPRIYGRWAGNERGTKEDFDRCIKEVRGDGWISYQCLRKRGHGKDKLYCKQHAKMMEVSDAKNMSRET